MTVQPRTVILLTADAFGVLPPIARPHAQAAYHFISGYTAKLAGTEVGIKEPKATFSACFGAPFMPRHPGEYARMLIERLAHQDADVWLVNTGWTGGPYGKGERMNIATRDRWSAQLDASLAHVATADRPDVRHRGPAPLPGRAGLVPGSALDLEGSRRLRPSGPSAGDDVRRELAAFADGVTDDIRRAGPIIGDPGGPGFELSGPGEG